MIEHSRNCSLVTSEFAYTSLCINVPIKNRTVVITGEDVLLGGAEVSSEVLAGIEEVFVLEFFEDFGSAQVEDAYGGALFAAHEDMVAV